MPDLPTWPGGGGGGGGITQAELDAAIATRLAANAAAGGVLAGNYPNPAFAADMATQAELDAAIATRLAANAAAGGVLAGAYPNPGFAVDMATQAELDAAIATRQAAGAAAGGVLAGAYPNPGFAVDMATQAELDAEAALRAALDAAALKDGDAAGGVLAGAYPNPGFAVDMATQAELDAAIAAAQRVLDRVTAPLDVANDATERTFYTFNVPANTLGANGMLRLTLVGDMLQNSGTPGLRVRVKLGATTMYDDQTAGIGQSATRREVRLTLTLANQGATNDQILGGQFSMSDPAAATVGRGPLDVNATHNSVLGGDGAEDTTADKALTVTVQWTAANAAVSVRRQYALLELL